MLSYHVVAAVTLSKQFGATYMFDSTNQMELIRENSTFPHGIN